jgi:hypothetical protein
MEFPPVESRSPDTSQPPPEGGLRPAPDPDLPDVMVTNGELMLWAVHEQPLSAMTPTVPVAAAAENTWLVGEIEKWQFGVTVRLTGII